jgi:hypothetical protein
LNPTLLVGALEEALGESPYGALITRMGVFTADGKVFA